MPAPREIEGLRQVQEHLVEWLGTGVTFRRESSTGGSQADLLVRAGKVTFVIELKGASDAAAVATAIERAQQHASSAGRSTVPVVAVPFMGDVGRRLCAESGVSWLDLSGNAEIVAPGYRVHVEGKPNKFKRPGRPSTVFAPRSSRIARQLLIAPQRSFHQRDLARVTGLDEGSTSRIVRRLEADGLVERDDSGAVRAKSRKMLLDSWREQYDFSKHVVTRGHVPSRSGEEALHNVVERLQKKKVRCAASGLGAAWLLTKFAGFRLVTVFLDEAPAESLLKALSFRAEERGANTWLVVPNDEGVFAGADERDGIPCVHPVQAYLDLKAHPERAGEAAEELRKCHLAWKS